MCISLTVQKYVPGPTRCRLCHRLRHSERACGHPPRCGRCGSLEHQRESCKSPPCCPLCKGPHEVSDAGCPAWAQERKRIQEAILGKVVQQPSPALSPAPPALSSQQVFPALSLKRAGPSPPPPPASKRWASPSPSPAPVANPPTNPDIIRILENQGRMLEQLMRTNESILQLLLRLVPVPAATAPAPAAAAVPADGPVSATTPASTSGVPQISVGPEHQAPLDPTPKRSPKTRGEKGKLAVKIPQARSPVYSLGKDPASPMAANIATFDYKEQ